MGPDSFLIAQRTAAFLGREISSDQQARLETYCDWLRAEAVGAGGIGPAEAGRLWDRHIADSLSFLPALDDAETCLDIGSGVGLPGIPLAIVAPQVVFTLLDRAGRRCDLMRRATAILQLENCRVVQGDVAAIGGKFDSVVSRAAIPVETMMIHVKQLLRAGGTAILGLTRSENAELPDADVAGLRTSLLRIPPKILDSGATLLRIEAT